MPLDAEAIIDAVPNPAIREDSRVLAALMTEVTGEPAHAWLDKVIGFGNVHYRYASGREGDTSALGFSPTKRGLTIYFLSGFVGYDDLLDRLGTSSCGKTCLYVRRLDDVDLDVLRQLIERSARHIDQTVRALGALPRQSEMPPFDLAEVTGR